MKKKTDIKFSKLLKDLENTVAQMEREDISLEDSFSLYKQGIDLAQNCYKKLKTIEEKITLVSESDNQTIEEKEVDKEELSRIQSQQNQSTNDKETNEDKATKGESGARTDASEFPGLFEAV